MSVTCSGCLSCSCVCARERTSECVAANRLECTRCTVEYLKLETLNSYVPFWRRRCRLLSNSFRRARCWRRSENSTRRRNKLKRIRCTEDGARSRQRHSPLHCNFVRRQNRFWKIGDKKFYLFPRMSILPHFVCCGDAHRTHGPRHTQTQQPYIHGDAEHWLFCHSK